MKKLLKGLLAAAMMLGLTACGGGNTGDDKEATKVAILLPHVGDQSYMDVTAHAEVLLEEKYGDAIEVNVVEMGDDEADWEPANRLAAGEGYDIIVSGNWQYEAAMLTVAKDFPDVKYVNFDYSDAAANSLENVYAVTYAAHEIGYLTGVVAAVKSKSGIIGGVVGQDNAGMNQFMAGYIQGASDVNKDIKVIISYVGSYTDAPKGKEISNQMIKQGADVIWGCAGGSGNGVFEAIAEHEGEELWAIGVDTDQYVSMAAQEKLANTILTSGLKNCDVAIMNAVTQIIEGTAPFGTQKMLGYADGAVGLAENDYYKANMTEDELATVKTYTDKVLNGETKVVDELTQPGVFADLYAKYGLK